MYICMCNAVNESAIEAAIVDGATTLHELSMATGVATSCGKCASQATRILQRSQESKSLFSSIPENGQVPMPTLRVVV